MLVTLTIERRCGVLRSLRSCLRRIVSFFGVHRSGVAGVVGGEFRKRHVWLQRAVWQGSFSDSFFITADDCQV